MKKTIFSVVILAKHDCTLKSAVDTWNNMCAGQEFYPAVVIKECAIAHSKKSKNLKSFEVSGDTQDFSSKEDVGHTVSIYKELLINPRYLLYGAKVELHFFEVDFLTVR